MRLIDADKLIARFKELKGSDTLANMFVSDVIKDIKKMPTAYDMEKVVKRLENDEKHTFDGCINKRYAVVIVKGGVVDAESI